MTPSPKAKVYSKVPRSAQKPPSPKQQRITYVRSRLVPWAKLHKVLSRRELAVFMREHGKGWPGARDYFAEECAKWLGVQRYNDDGQIDEKYLQEVWVMFAAYTDNLSELLGDADQRLRWFWEECAMGARPLQEVHFEKRVFRNVRTLKTLAEIICYTWKPKP